ncbi:E3 ubiquitin-protein ligase SINA-like 10 [Brachypodium distachyon]|uniref:E3 ubiquitin-protein ligase SINA-like 10 n=1 Tax=Brachypodium distachyon TaxID=15368 RepID=UPI0001C717CA|nr:E3 ubiquitin-protein ligase SINA-like 10 [Brachypodium distachyon]|eukprot:XP_010232940.1 E3 ubiquitin-protein ligase SINA-like 10 [Brachypodium distachyon]
MSERNKRGAPSPVDRDGGKKVKAVAQVMKNEQERLQQQGEENEREEGEVGAEDGSLAAPPPPPSPPLPQIDARIDVALFHCKSCCRPLKPPLFECEAEGHVVCCRDYCRHMHGELCSRTEPSRPALNAILTAAKVSCVYREFGCGLHIVYHDAMNHLRTCLHAPCLCPEPGCSFLGTPLALLGHFDAAHARAISTVSYGHPLKLTLPLSQPWHFVLGQDDRSVFLVSLGTLNGSSSAMGVSLVCVRVPRGRNTGASSSSWVYPAWTTTWGL